MCEVCAAAQRRGSLGNALEERDRLEEEEDDEELDLLEGEEDSDVWPPHPFQCVPLFSLQSLCERTDVPLAQTDATRHPGSPARAGRRMTLVQPPAYPGFDKLYRSPDIP